MPRVSERPQAESANGHYVTAKRITSSASRPSTIPVTDPRVRPLCVKLPGFTDGSFRPYERPANQRRSPFSFLARIVTCCPRKSTHPPPIALPNARSPRRRATPSTSGRTRPHASSLIEHGCPPCPPPSPPAPFAPAPRPRAFPARVSPRPAFARPLRPRSRRARSPPPAPCARRAPPSRAAASSPLGTFERPSVSPHPADPPIAPRAPFASSGTASSAESVSSSGPYPQAPPRRAFSRPAIDGSRVTLWRTTLHIALGLFFFRLIRRLADAVPSPSSPPSSPAAPPPRPPAAA